jgi:hypothetical protein
MVDLQTISIVVASASVVAGITYYAFQMRHQTKARQTDLILRLASFYNSREFHEALTRVLGIEYADYKEFEQKYGSLFSPAPNDLLISLQMVGSFFENLGVLVSEKLLDLDLVAKLFTADVYWKKTELLVKELRKQSGNPAYYEWFEFLYNELQKREKKALRKAN